MIKIGISGKSGFIAKHLINNLNLKLNKFKILEFKREYFNDDEKLDDFLINCDFFIHLAAINRHDSEQHLYVENIRLVDKIINSLERTNSKPNIILSSSTQENRDNLYGKSKRICRLRLESFCLEKNINFNGLIIPNVFGPFGKPFYNSVIATFCHQLTNNLEPKIEIDSEIKLIYIDKLIKSIIDIIDLDSNYISKVIEPEICISVSQILKKLLLYREIYFERGEIPELNSEFDLNLFNTYRSYINHETYFPRSYVQHKDDRGNFTELVRTKLGGQISFSTTYKNITRGNHFHTRKIERFSVIKGNAEINIKNLNDNKKTSFIVSGDNPVYIDMPIWYSHNIKNIGNEELLTVFWINEPYNPESPDTYFEKV